MTGALHACGFAAPATLVTGSTESACRILARHPHGVGLSSPGGTGMVWLEPRPTPLRFTVNGPCRLQAVLRGRWRRVFVVGDGVFAGEAGMASLAGAVGEPWRRVPLPASVAKRCVQLARRLELEFMELLLVLGGQRAVVLQINDLPNPARCEAALQEAIVAALVTRLITPQSQAAAGGLSSPFRRSGVSVERRKQGRSGAIGGIPPKRRYDSELP